MRVLFVSVFIVIIDQATKLLVKGISIPFLNINIEGMHYGQSVDIFGSFLRFTFVENPGMAFGLEMGETSKLFLSLFSIIASIGLILYIYKLQDKSFGVRVALALILGGAVGNLIDRTFYGIIFEYAPVFYGRVVDFINVDFIDFTLFGRTFDRWPIFNIADIAVTVGVGFLLIFHREVEEPAEEEAQDDSPKTEDDVDTDAVITENVDEISVPEEQTADEAEIIKDEDEQNNNRKEV